MSAQAIWSSSPLRKLKTTCRKTNVTTGELVDNILLLKCISNKSVLSSIKKKLKR